MAEEYKYLLDKTNGYLRRRSETGSSIFKHREVWELLNGKIPKNMHIHHIDGNKLNNDINNLQMLSIAEHNRIHKTGNTYCKGKSQTEQHKKKIAEAKLKNKLGKEKGVIL